MKYKPRKFFSIADIARIKQLRLEKRSWRDIGVAFGCNYETARQAVDPAFRLKRNEQISLRARVGAPGSTPRRASVPSAVEAERQRAFSRDITITAALLGDPLPGRSALDRLHESGASSMKPAPYCPDTLKRIKAGATARELGWDDGLYTSVCRRHSIEPTLPFKPAILDSVKIDPAPPIFRAGVIKRVDNPPKPPTPKGMHFTFTVTPGMHAGAHATADEENTSAAAIIRQAMEWACEPKVILADWRKGVRADSFRQITTLLSVEQRQRFTDAATDRELKLPEFCRRALAGYLKHQSFGV